MSEEKKRKVRITVRLADMEFEIEADEDQIEASVEKVLSAALKATSTVAAVKSLPAPKTRTCKGLIQELWREGWFTVRRGLGEVHEELARRGYHYDRTAVAHALLDLVREGILHREGKPRRYRYIQKRPPPTTQIPAIAESEREEMAISSPPSHPESLEDAPPQTATNQSW